MSTWDTVFRLGTINYVDCVDKVEGKNYVDKVEEIQRRAMTMIGARRLCLPEKLENEYRAWYENPLELWERSLNV